MGSEFATTPRVTVLQAIRRRRSVREYRGEPIPDDVLVALIDALRWAPSAGNLQSRQFYFVFDAEKKRQLAHTALRQMFMARAPVVVVACADHRIRREYGERGVELYCLLDVAAAIQNMMLVAHESGLETCWVGAFSEDRVREIAGVPAHLRPVSLIPVGFPADHPEPPRRRSRKDSVTMIR